MGDNRDPDNKVHRKPFEQMTKKYLKTIVKKQLKESAFGKSCEKFTVTCTETKDAVVVDADDCYTTANINCMDTSDILMQTVEKTTCLPPAVSLLFPNTHLPENYNLESYVNYSSLSNELACWGIYSNISRDNFNQLLKILKKPNRDISEYENLPQDCRQLRKKITRNQIMTTVVGKYYHFGIAAGILNTLNINITKQVPDIVHLDVNVDGLPLSKSSGSQFWLILGSIVKLDENSSVKLTPFVIGAWHGFKKPSTANELMQDFINECLHLEKNRFYFEGKHIKIKISKFICDAPAKSFILCLKGHNSYYGCTKCTVEGEYINYRMCYNNLNSPLRTDNNFRSGIYGNDYHQSVSPLLQLDFDTVGDVVLDYMHLVCLGVVKRLIQFWYKGKQDVRMNSTDIEKVNKILFQFRTYISTKDFARLPRNISDVDRWKATEFRQFLLYTGPIALKNRLKPSQYTHFITLHCAIRILSSSKLCFVHNDFAKELLVYFVRNYKKLYGFEYVTHNVHNLIHLHADVLKFGALDNFSTFKFENYMSSIKKILKTCNKPLEQMINRINERLIYIKPSSNSNYNTPLKLCNLKYNYFEPLLNKVVNCYQCLRIHYYEFGTKISNNHVITRDGVVLKIIKIVQCSDSKKVYIIAKRYNLFMKFFDTPCSSKLFNCGLVDQLSDVNEIFNAVDEKLTKCIYFRRYVISFVE